MIPSSYKLLLHISIVDFNFCLSISSLFKGKRCFAQSGRVCRRSCRKINFFNFLSFYLLVLKIAREDDVGLGIKEKLLKS